jgi:hypothetical protein
MESLGMFGGLVMCFAILQHRVMCCHAKLKMASKVAVHIYFRFKRKLSDA